MLKRAHQYAITTILAFAPASGALADITAQDVWQNMQAYAGAFGGTYTADVADTDNGMQLGTPTFSVSVSLPTELTDGADLGPMSLTMGMPTITLTNNADGTVTVKSPEKGTYLATVAFPEADNFSVPIDVTWQGSQTIASGSPGSVTYTYSAEMLTGTSSFDMPDPLTEGVSTAMNIAIKQSGVAGAFTITEGDLLTLVGSSTSDEISQRFETTIDGVAGSSISTSLTRDQKTEGTVTLPTNDVSLFDLASTLRRGVSFDLSVAHASYEQLDQVSFSDDLDSKTEVVTGAGVTSAKLDTNGLALNGSVSNVSLALQMPIMGPEPLSFEASAVSFDMLVPLLKSEAASEFAYDFGFKDIVLGDSIWAMFDPAGQLPRDPAQLELDLSGAMKYNIEWLDFLSLEDNMMSLAGLPVEPENLSINALSIAAAGAKIDAKGALTFDPTDLVTYDGMPRPDGNITLDIQGIERLMDTLTAMGLLPEDQAMGARMMLGGFTKPVGEDHLTTTIEMTPEGHVSANGQRIK